jgi:hypothetical protein
LICPITLTLQPEKSYNIDQSVGRRQTPVTGRDVAFDPSATSNLITSAADWVPFPSRWPVQGARLSGIAQGAFSGVTRKDSLMLVLRISRSGWRGRNRRTRRFSIMSARNFRRPSRPKSRSSGRCWKDRTGRGAGRGRRTNAAGAGGALPDRAGPRPLTYRSRVARRRPLLHRAPRFMISVAVSNPGKLRSVKSHFRSWHLASFRGCAKYVGRWQAGRPAHLSFTT